MGFSDRILGKKNVNGGPHIDGVSPSFALTGGEVRINGSGLRPQDLLRPKVKFGDVAAPIVVSSDGFLVTRVPEGAVSGPVVVATNGYESNPHPVKVAVTDRKSTRLNSSHSQISYAVFCLKKKICDNLYY